MPISPKTTHTAFDFRLFRTMLVAAGFGSLVAACSLSPEGPPQDVGSMAFPAPLAQGNLATTVVAGRQPFDTGSMAYPEGVPQGAFSRAAASSQGFDTGSMAYPAPLPAGNFPATRFR